MYSTDQSVINFMETALLPDDPAVRRTRRKDARPGELLSAALALFVEKGFAATRVEEVAARAGVSKGTLFLYYASKEALFKAVVRESIAGPFALWAAEMEQFEGSTPDLLRYAMKQWWIRMGATQAGGIAKLMTSEARNFPELAHFYVEEVVHPAHLLVERLLRRGVERGEFALANPAAAVYSVIAPLVFLANWWHSMGQCGCMDAHINPEAFLQQQAELILHGLIRRT